MNIEKPEGEDDRFRYRERIWPLDSEELKSRMKKFTHDCVKLAADLPKSVLGGVVRGQLIRRGTSTAANYRAVCIAQSKAAFASKMSITLEECDESWFWIKFSIDENLVDRDSSTSLMREAEKRTRICAASRRTSSERRD